MVSAEGSILAWNSAAKTLLGDAGVELRGSSVSQLVLEPGEKVHRYLNLCARSREMLPGALTFRTARGDGFECRVDGAVVRRQTDNSPGLILLRCRARSESTSQFTALNEKISALSHEISERRRAEAELYAQRESLRVTLSSIGDAVIATDTKGVITFINPVAENLTGWQGGEAIGRPLHEVFRIINEETRQPTDNPVSRVLSSGVVVGLANHTILVSRDGVERPIEDSAAPIRDASGLVMGVVLVFRDGSKRRAAERLDKELLKREQAVREQAEKANRMKDEFLAVLSHELRTPLSAITGWALLLRQKTLPPEKIDHGLEVIERNVRAQTQLINDLLDISRILSGKLSVDYRPVDLVSVVSTAIDSVHLDAAKKGISVHAELGVEACLVQGDPDRLRQVIWNLLQNSIKFTPSGGNIEVRLERDSTAARITVKDSGVGIEPEFLPHLFERFRQADSTITRRHGGLGLGLALVREITELHGGKVRADSPGEGKGTSITIELPPRTAPLVTGERSKTGIQPSSHYSLVPINRLAGLCILLVEDDPDSREIIRLTCRATALRSSRPAPQSQAREQLRRRVPDVLVSDLGLPDEDGLSLIRSVRKLPPAQGGLVPALALTAFARNVDSERATPRRVS